KPDGATSFPTSCEAHKSYHPEIPHHNISALKSTAPRAPSTAILAVVLDPNKKRRPVSHWRKPSLAATNKCLARSNKSRSGGEATKKRESSVSLQAKRDDKRRASGRSDLPSDDVGLHRRRGGLRRNRVTPRP